MTHCKFIIRISNNRLSLYCFIEIHTYIRIKKMIKSFPFKALMRFQHCILFKCLLAPFHSYRSVNVIVQTHKQHRTVISTSFVPFHPLNWIINFMNVLLRCSLLQHPGNSHTIKHHWNFLDKLRFWICDVKFALSKNMI